MGGGTSKTKPKVPPRPANENKQTMEVNGQETLCKVFHLTASDAEIKQKAHGSQVLLEISPTGFRLLRSSTEEPVIMFPWGQIHSWAHSHDKFSFRYFEERTKQPHFYSFHTKEVNKLLEHMQLVIDGILQDRKSKAISTSEFADLLAMLNSCDPSTRVECIVTATKMNFFTSGQARQLVECLSNSFDKVEAARVLHARLVDQNHFNNVLEVLDCDDDRENVWARISELKKHTGPHVGVQA